jgi:hypothetical protein
MRAEQAPSVRRFNDRLTQQNIRQTLNDYLASVEHLGTSISALKGIPLFEALKRDHLESGPYPGVTLFEAANRVMTDLVMLYGVRWLLASAAFPFTEYSVEYGNEDKKGFDIQATAGGKVLIGEVFNVARSFFPVKKNATLKKLRRPQSKADFKLVMFNSDAVLPEYSPQLRANERFVVVRVGTGEASLVGPTA